MPIRRFSELFFVFSTLALALARPVSARSADKGGDDSADPSARVQKLNRYAMTLFDDGNLQLAERTLMDALDELNRANLEGTPAALATHGNLGILYSVGLKNPNKAVLHFKKALAIKPDLKMSRQRTAAETEANLARAKEEMAKGVKDPDPVGKTRALAASAVNPFSCPTEGEVQAGDEITLKCLASGELRPATVTLYYKANGGSQYKSSQMVKAETVSGTTTWVGQIPGADTKGTWVPFYFEARNAHGASLALSGREDSPSVMTIKGGEAAKAVTQPVAAAREDIPEGEAEGEETEREEIDDSNPLARLENERRKEREGSKGTWWISLGIGSGIGYANGNATEAFGKQKVAFTPGIALAALGHIVPELGYFLGRNTALSLAGRDQLIVGGTKGTAWGANSILLRLLFFTEDDERIRWYVAPTVGWGDAFRFQVDAQVVTTDNQTGQTVKDTVRGGPYVAGMGGGMLYKLGRRLRWTLDSQLLLGFTNVSAVLDLSTGMRVEF